MTRSRPQPRVVLARNLRFLMGRRGYTEAEVARRAGISQKTVNNILNERVSTSLERADAIAKVFGLALWQMTLPELPESFDVMTDMELVFGSWLRANEEGRELFRMVAERQAAYQDNHK